MFEPVQVTVASSSSIIGFEKEGNVHWPVWDRFLTIENKRAYHIGNVCGTCAFFFQRLEGANQSISAAQIADRLNTGIYTVDPDFAATLGQVLPAGEYSLSSFETLPRLVSPGAADDYFGREQVDLWGIDPFWALPHDPRVPYYRGRALPLGDRRALFEFIIPMFPPLWLQRERVEHYQVDMESGLHPTAFVLSVLDVKGPANWEGEPAIIEHWCLAHYLLDGHHKTYAASLRAVPVHLLSFLSFDESVASEEQIRTTLLRISNGPAT